MKFWEAMKAVHEGKSIRRTDWRGSGRVYFNKDIYLGLCHETDESLGDYFMHSTDFISGWEIYEQPEKTFSFMDAMKLVEDGKKVKRLGWNSIPFIKRFGTSIGIKSGVLLDPEGNQVALTLDDFNELDWVEVKK